MEISANQVAHGLPGTVEDDNYAPGDIETPLNSAPGWLNLV